jgi:cell wall-associated NlpC family hydrolase
MTRHWLARGTRRGAQMGAIVGLSLAAGAGALGAQQVNGAAAWFAAVTTSPAIRVALTGVPLSPAGGAAPAPFAAFGTSAQALRDSVVAIARAQIGHRYVLGGQTPERGFDCSGLVRYVMAALSIDLPRTANQQARVGRDIPRDTSRLRPGDLLTFGKGKRVTHIGIYVGNGRMVHASSKAGRVIETNLLRSAHPLIKPWRGARSLVAHADSAVAQGS